MGIGKKYTSSGLVFIVLVVIMSLGGVLGATFWENTSQIDRETVRKPFPERTSLSLNNIIEKTITPYLHNGASSSLIPRKTITRKEHATWTMYEYDIPLAQPGTFSQIAASLSEAIYTSGGEIFQKYIQPEQHQATLVIGSGVYITHTLVFTWPSPVVAEKSPTQRQEQVGAAKLAQTAIVIDDLGASKHVVFQLLDLGEDFTFSILPHLEYSTEIATLLHGREKEILLHLPMEPRNPLENPGKGALMASMGLEQIHRTVERNLLSVPFATGSNNHMGSLLTADPEKMEMILRQLARHGLFFLDSRTIASSVAYDIAQRLGVKSAVRKVFLDADPDLSVMTVKARLRELAALAEQGQPAIAIGHPKDVTLQALREILPEFTQRSIHIVRVSQFIR